MSFHSHSQTQTQSRSNLCRTISKANTSRKVTGVDISFRGFSVRVRKVYWRRGTAGESVVSSLPSPNQDVKALDLPEDALNAGGIIVDSGTKDTLWNRGIAMAFNEVFKEMNGGRDHNNYEISLTHDELMALPTILFQLVSSEEVNVGMDAYKTPGLVGSLDPQHPFDVLLAFPPSHYMRYEPGTGMYASRFYTEKLSGSILGANSIMGHDVLFDADNNRIGWAEPDCEYTKLVSDNGFAFPITGHPQSPTSTATTLAPGYAPSSVPFLDWFEECSHTDCKGRLPIDVVFFGLFSICTCCCLCYCSCVCCCWRGRNGYENTTSLTKDLELTTFRDDLCDTHYKYGESNDHKIENDEDDRELNGEFA